MAIEVLGLENGEIKAGARVTSEYKINDSAEQTWFRGAKDQNGWFTLRNLASGKFLTADTYTKPMELRLTIQGNDQNSKKNL